MIEQIGRRAGKQIERLTDDIKLQIGTDAGKLDGAVALGIGAAGLIVVPVEGGFSHGLFSSIDVFTAEARRSASESGSCGTLQTQVNTISRLAHSLCCASVVRLCLAQLSR